MLTLFLETFLPQPHLYFILFIVFSSRIFCTIYLPHFLDISTLELDTLDPDNLIRISSVETL